MADQVLVDQPTNKPTRKVRVAGYMAAGLTVATYVATSIQGESVVSEDAFLNALGVLGAAIIPVISAWVAKEEVPDHE